MNLFIACSDLYNISLLHSEINSCGNQENWSGGFCAYVWKFIYITRCSHEKEFGEVGREMDGTCREEEGLRPDKVKNRA